MIPREKSIPTFKSQSFLADVMQGKEGNQAVLKSGRFYRHYLNTKCKPGDTITMTLTNQKPKRTIRQNSYYWAYIAIIAAETGNGPDDLHTLFKHEFLSGTVVEVMGKQVVREASTTDLSRLEFGEYIDKIASLTGVEPPPKQNYDV